MMKWLRRSIVLGVLLLSGCSLSGAPGPDSGVSPAVTLRALFDKLPGAVALAEPVVGLAYPDENLFAKGAALPLAGGVEVLDPLCDLLLEESRLRWQGTVRAKTESGREHDAALAAKRLELLQRYLRNRGVADGQIVWTAAAEDGFPLELQVPELNQVQLPSSAPVKE